MNLVIELLSREKEFINHLKFCNNADEQELQMLVEIDQALQLLQAYDMVCTCKNQTGINTFKNKCLICKKEHKQLL